MKESSQPECGVFIIITDRLRTILHVLTEEPRMVIQYPKTLTRNLPCPCYTVTTYFICNVGLKKPYNMQKIHQHV